MCLFQLFVASSRLVLVFSNELAGASLVALPFQEKIEYTKSRSSLLSGHKLDKKYKLKNFSLIALFSKKIMKSQDVNNF
jgi:hypothetical protein